jgi:hypothetical protein
VFATPIYLLRVMVIAESGPTATLVVARVGDTTQQLLRPTVDGEVLGLQKLLKPTFKLRTNADAKVLQQALDVVFPYFMESDKKVRGFRRSGKAWIFARDALLGPTSGYVFETNAGGAIRSVKYLLELP